MNLQKEPYLDLKYFIIGAICIAVTIIAAGLNPQLFQEKTFLDPNTILKVLPERMLFTKNLTETKINNNQFIAGGPLNLIKAIETDDLSTQHNLIINEHSIIKKNVNFKKLWELNLPNSQFIKVNSIFSNDLSISFVTVDDQLYILNAVSGKLLYTQLSFKTITPTIVSNSLLTFINDGKFIVRNWQNNTLVFEEHLADTYVSIFSIPKSNFIFLQSQTKFQIFDLLKLEFIYSNSLDKVKGLHTIALKNKIVFSTIENNIFTYDTVHGKETWRMKLMSSSIAPPLTVPNSSLIVFYLDNNYVRTINVDTGQRKWRLNVFNESAFKGVFLLQITKAFANIISPENSTSYLIGSACGKEKLCFIHPETAKPVYRLKIKNYILMGPLKSDKEYIYIPVKSAGKFFQLKFKSQ